MRQAGNSKKKEKTPDGSKDENVFDIQQGVCISLFIKNKNSHKQCKVYHADLYGTREEKYTYLANTLFKDVSSFGVSATKKTKEGKNVTEIFF